MNDWDEVAAVFGLGPCLSAPELVAHGWGGHNALWKVRTVNGLWAVKQLGRDHPDDASVPFAIEVAAHRSGIPCPEPVPTTEGACYAIIESVAYRCHGWVEGNTKLNEEVFPAEAGSMGELVAALHQLELPSERQSENAIIPTRIWTDLAAKGRAQHASWAELMDEQAHTLNSIQSRAG